MSLEEPLDDAPMAVKRFWKSDVNSLSELLLPDELLAVPESVAVLLEADESDCARFEIAEARSLP